MSNIVKKFNEYINESKNDDYYEIDYYVRVGQHGNVDSYKTFDEAYKEGLKFLEREKKEGHLNEDDILYIGIQSNTNKFAILYISKDYLDMTDENDFSDASAYKKFVEVANKYLKDKKPQIAEYE